MIITLLRLRRHPQHVLGRVVEEASPGGVVLREDHGPVGVLLRDDEETIRAGRQRLSLDLDVVRGGEDGVLVRAGAPRTFLAAAESEVDHAVGAEIAPDLAATIHALRTVHVRAAVVDRDFHHADLLDDGLPLVAAGRRLGDLRACRECAERGCNRDKNPMSHFSSSRLWAGWYRELA